LEGYLDFLDEDFSKFEAYLKLFEERKYMSGRYISAENRSV
jgi:hypothetical protein